MERLYHTNYNIATGETYLEPYSDAEMEQTKYHSVISEYIRINTEANNPKEYKNIYTPEEIEQIKSEINEYKWKKFRETRGVLLSESDHMVLPDLWARYNDDKKTAISEYRQALRDLPSTITDINNVVYPEKP